MDAAMMTDCLSRLREIQDNIRVDRARGEQALCRLLPVAQRFTHQGERVARLLLGCYNGRRFPFDLTNLRGLDYELMDDCLAVLRMDANPYHEVHLYFPNGGKVFEQLADDWGFEEGGVK
jgi:hypothetical protein